MKSDKFNAHAFFMLDTPINPRKLKEYLKSLNLRDGIHQKLRLNEARSALKFLIDPTVGDESRIIYIAPPLSDKKLPLDRDQYISLVEKDQDTVVIPSFNPGAIDTQLNTIRDNLRKAEGLAPKKSMRIETDSYGQTYELDKDPDAIKIYLHRANPNSGWVTCNINDGDSNAYYFPLGRITQQTIMRNWKHEPYFFIAKADPEFQKEWNNSVLPKLIEENPELGKLNPDDLNHDLIGIPENEHHFVAFDIKESAYKVVRYDPHSRDLEITRHELEKLNNYCQTAGIDNPEVRPIYRFLTDITSNRDNPIDHDKRTINTFILPKLLDKNYLPMPTDIEPQSLTAAQTADRIANECPLIWSQITSAFNDDKESLHLFLNWYALAVFDRVKLRTAWILQGTQGTGKSFITQNLTRGLLNNNPDYAPNLTLDILNDLSNAWAEKAIFVEWEESSTNKTIRDLKLIDEIKRLVTGKDITIRKMRTDGFQMKSQFNMVFTTNHNAPFTLDESDRRFFVAPRQSTKWEHRITEEQRKQWDPNFDEILSDELPKFAVSMHLLKRDITKANTVVMNNAKQLMINGVKTAGQALLEALNSGDLEWITEGLEDEYHNPAAQIMQSTARTIMKMAAVFIADKEKPYPLKWSEVATLHAAINGEPEPMSTKKIKTFALNQGMEEQRLRRNGEVIRGLVVAFNQKSLTQARELGKVL